MQFGSVQEEAKVVKNDEKKKVLPSKTLLMIEKQAPDWTPKGKAAIPKVTPDNIIAKP